MTWTDASPPAWIDVDGDRERVAIRERRIRHDHAFCAGRSTKRQQSAEQGWISRMAAQRGRRGGNRGGNRGGAPMVVAHGWLYTVIYLFLTDAMALCFRLFSKPAY